MIKKGIILAGGNGTRLYPLTKYMSKQLLPIYDKPMIYYSLSILMLSKIRDILLITKKEDQASFKKILSDGSHLGLKISYAVQDDPKGLVDAFIIGEKFINKKKVMLILGDNLLYGQGIEKSLIDASKKNISTIFGYKVNNPKSMALLNLIKMET